MTPPTNRNDFLRSRYKFPTNHLYIKQFNIRVTYCFVILWQYEIVSIESDANYSNYTCVTVIRIRSAAITQEKPDRVLIKGTPSSTCVSDHMAPGTTGVCCITIFHLKAHLKLKYREMAFPHGISFNYPIAVNCCTEPVRISAALYFKRIGQIIWLL